MCVPKRAFYSMTSMYPLEVRLWQHVVPECDSEGKVGREEYDYNVKALFSTEFKT